MKHLLTLILLALSTSAFALGWGNDNPSSNQTNLQATSVDVSNRIAADTRAAAQSYAAVDVSGAVTAIDGAIPAVTSIGTAVLGVLVVVAVFKWVRRAF